jgi:hypothetical protein
MFKELSSKQLAILLQICLFISLLNSVSAPVVALQENLPTIFLINGKLLSINFNDLPSVHKSLVMIISFLSEFVWVYALWLIYNLCEAFKANDFFSFKNLRLLRSFGICLISIAFIDSMSTPLINYFFYSTQIIPQLPNSPFSLMLEIEILTVGVFFFLITKIMERALNIDEENKLTV